jgi:hypothetical protein
MAWWQNIVRVAIAASIIVAVAELSRRYPRAGAVLLSLPLVSILAFLFGWFQHHDLPAISKVANETLILVPLGLPFFLPLAFAERFGLSFWMALSSGLLLASVTIGAWLWLAPTEA